MTTRNPHPEVERASKAALNPAPSVGEMLLRNALEGLSQTTVALGLAAVAPNSDGIDYPLTMGMATQALGRYGTKIQLALETLVAELKTERRMRVEAEARLDNVISGRSTADLVSETLAAIDGNLSQGLPAGS